MSITSISVNFTKNGISHTDRIKSDEDRLSIIRQCKEMANWPGVRFVIANNSDWSADFYPQKDKS